MTNHELKKVLQRIKEETGIDMKEAAAMMPVNRSYLSRFVNSKIEKPLTRELTIKLQNAFPKYFKKESFVIYPSGNTQETPNNVLQEDQFIYQMFRAEFDRAIEQGLRDGRIAIAPGNADKSKTVSRFLKDDQQLNRIEKINEKLLEELTTQLKWMRERVDSNLDATLAGLANISTRQSVDREVVYRSLSRLEKKNQDALLKEADKIMSGQTDADEKQSKHDSSGNEAKSRKPVL
jgi:hypothetical protein